jgi:hypothetical protein
VQALLTVPEQVLLTVLVRAPAPVLVTTLAQPRPPNRTKAAALGLTDSQSCLSSPTVGTTAPDAVKRLVDLSACNAQADHFDQNRKVFLSGDYKEEQLHAHFLAARRSAFVVRTYLGPVIHEESMKVAGPTKAPDYTFRIGGAETQ